MLSFAASYTVQFSLIVFYSGVEVWHQIRNLIVTPFGFKETGKEINPRPHKPRADDIIV